MYKRTKRVKKKSINIILLLISLAGTGYAKAADEPSGQGILAIAKYAGACGILVSMVHFQKTTKMPSGDEFVARFWSTEAARLGLSVQQLSDRCNQSITAYDRMWKAMGTQ